MTYWSLSIALLLAQPYLPDGCEAASDAVDSIKSAVTSDPAQGEHVCGCEHYRKTGTMWNMYPCDRAGGKQLEMLKAKHMCCMEHTCRKVCF